MTEENSQPLVEQLGDSWRLTKHGLLQVTEWLEEEGFLNADLPEPFESNQNTASLLGSMMVEAADRALRERTDLDNDFKVLLALYASQAQVESDKGCR